MIARHIGVVRLRHRFRTAATTTGTGHARIGGCDKQHNRKRLQYRALLLDGALLDDVHHGNAAGNSKRFRAYFVPSPHATRRTHKKPPMSLLPVALTVGILWLNFVCSPASATPEIDAAAPTLVITTLDGRTFDLAKLRGKVVLVNYWATWCAPCRKEMPKLNAFYRRYRDRGLEIIGISIDFPRDFLKAENAAKAVGYPTALSKAVSEDGFGKPQGVPITWVVDADGKIRDRFIEVRDELLNSIVVPLLPH